MEVGAVGIQLGKRDASVTTLLAVHNCLGIATLYNLGDQEQKDRFLPDAISMKKICCFGLTEKNAGSDASKLKTTAVKVEGGYVINGSKRWIGNATFADLFMIWARNPEEMNDVQCFVVEKGMKGLSTSRIENKYSLRMVQNADIELKDVFVPDRNKLKYAQNFLVSTNKILTQSRLSVGFLGCGIGIGAYEAALKYTLKRKQFGKPIAQFQLT